MTQEIEWHPSTPKSEENSGSLVVWQFWGEVALIKKTASLGGGNSKDFYFHPDPWGGDPI